MFSLYIFRSIITINDLEYGKGLGSSKKLAKYDAAAKTLKILIPEIDTTHLSWLDQSQKEEEKGPDLTVSV